MHYSKIYQKIGIFLISPRLTMLQESREKIEGTYMFMSIHILLYIFSLNRKHSEVSSQHMVNAPTQWIFNADFVGKDGSWLLNGGKESKLDFTR